MLRQNCGKRLTCHDRAHEKVLRHQSLLVPVTCHCRLQALPNSLQVAPQWQHSAPAHSRSDGAVQGQERRRTTRQEQESAQVELAALAAAAVAGSGSVAGVAVPAAVGAAAVGAAAASEDGPEAEHV